MMSRYYHYENAAEALSRELTAPQLRALARAAGTGKRTAGKDQCAEELRRELLDEGAVRALLARLDDTGRAAVAYAAHNEHGYFDEEAFAANQGQPPCWGTYEYVGRTGFPDDPTLLWCFMPNGCSIADELRLLLQAILPAPEPPKVSAVENLPARVDLRGAPGRAVLTISEREDAAQAELLSVLRLIARSSLVVSSRTGRPGKPTLKALLSALADGQDFYDHDRYGALRAFAWPMLLQAAHAVFAEDGKLTLAPYTGVQALRDPPAQTLRSLWKAWLEHEIIDEIELTEIRCDAQGRRSLTETLGRRELVAQALASCPPGEWVAVDELLRYMRAASLRFRVSVAPETLYLTSRRRDNFGEFGPAVTYLLESTYVLCLLFEFVATLGMIDIAYASPEYVRARVHDRPYLSVHEGLCFIRVNALGRYCLGVSKDYSPARTLAPASITDDLLITAPGVSAVDAVRLDGYAKRTGDSTWQIDERTLLGALRDGALPRGLLELIEELGLTVPRKLTELTAELMDRLVSFEDEAVLLRCSSERQLASLLNDPTLARLALRTGPQTIAVSKSNEKAFRVQLGKLGHVAWPP